MKPASALVNSESREVELELATSYVAALQEHQALATPPMAIADRVRYNIASWRRQRRMAQLEHELTIIARQMRDRGVGSTSRWGILSCVMVPSQPAASVVLENTLDTLGDDTCR